MVHWHLFPFVGQEKKKNKKLMFRNSYFIYFGIINKKKAQTTKKNFIEL